MDWNSSSFQRAADNRANQESKMEATIQQLRNKISQLEKERTELLVAQTPNQTTIALLKDENRDLKMKVKNVEHELSEMKIKYNQLKMLQQQQERALTDQQHRVYAYENQLDKADYQLNSLGSNKQMSQQTIHALKEEVSMLKASMAVLESEKDRISVSFEEPSERFGITV
jgi:chromosome segregation ATPase